MTEFELALAGRSPIVGSPHEVVAAASLLRGLCDDLEAFRDFAGDALEQLNPLRARSVDRLRESVHGRLLAGEQGARLAFASAGRAFSAHAAEIEEIHATARTIEAEYAAHSMPAIYAADALAHLERVALARHRWEQQRELRRQAERLLATQLGGELEALRAVLTLVERGALGAGAVLGAALEAGTGAARYASARPRAATDDPRFGELIAGRLTAAQGAAVWNELDPEMRQISRLPAEQLAGLAVAAGVPASAQDQASRALLRQLRAHPDEAARLLGFGGDTPVPEGLDDQLSAMEKALRDAEQGSAQGAVQLLGLGSHDGVLTAAIVLGDLDTASRVGVLVSGMGSGVHGMRESVGAAMNLRDEAAGSSASAASAELAVVAWHGYHPPPMPDYADLAVLRDEHAVAGALPLASFLDGHAAARAASGGAEADTFVFAHSYGSTTAALALTQLKGPVDALVTFGSAGLSAPGGVAPEMFAERVFAVQAESDPWAPIGQRFSGRVDPRNLPGVTEFSAEGGDDLLTVTGHDLVAAPGGASVGYLSDGSAALAGMGSILASGSVRAERGRHRAKRAKR